jgi:hypothetical protein
MSDKAEEYRRRATEADEQAEAALEDSVKIAWLNVAKHWRDMADQAERMGR